MKKMILGLLLLVMLGGCALPWAEETVPPAEAPPMDAKTVFQTMFQRSGCIVLELHFSDGSSYGPYTCYTLPRDLKLDPELVTPVTDPDISGCDQWLTLCSGDGDLQLTLYRGSPDILCWQQDGGSRYYRTAEAAQQRLRKVFDRAEKQAFGRISFFSGKSGKAILDAYGETALPGFLYETAPGGLYHIEDYKLRKVTLDEKNGRILRGTVTYTVCHTLEEAAGLPFFGERTGGEDGWHSYQKTVYMEHQPDGKWHELAAADYHKVYTEEYAPFVPLAEPKETATEFLKELPERAAQLQQLRQPEDVAALAELFLQTTTAVPLSGKTDFDWTLFCGESAMRCTGLQALLREYVTREGAMGYFRGFVSGRLQLDTVILGEDTALVANDRIRLWFTKTAGTWRITDASITADT